MSRGQVECLAIVFISLFLVTAAYFRSVWIGLLAMIPNSIPILCTFGVMGFLGITLNIGTAMTTGIAIGLAMNDTTHFISRFRQECREGGDFDRCLRKSMRSLIQPMVFSSVVMMAGYLVCATSQFRLTVLFGLLCAQTIFVALLSDLLITPWVVSVFRKCFIPVGTEAYPRERAWRDATTSVGA